MLKVTIRNEGGKTIEISDLTFEQVKELAGVNGHHSATPSRSKKDQTGSLETVLVEREGTNDVHGFIAALSERGRAFINTLRSHPNGIEANDLAPLLELNDPRQIGGFTGGGLAKIAKKYRISMRDIYKSQVTFPQGKRTRMFYPGKFIKSGTI